MIGWCNVRRNKPRPQFVLHSQWEGRMTFRILTVSAGVLAGKGGTITDSTFGAKRSWYLAPFGEDTYPCAHLGISHTSHALLCEQQQLATTTIATIARANTQSRTAASDISVVQLRKHSSHHPEEQTSEQELPSTPHSLLATTPFNAASVLALQA